MDLKSTFWRKLPVFALFGPKMEVHMCFEVSGCTEINIKVKGIKSVYKQNYQTSGNSMAKRFNFWLFLDKSYAF